MAVTARSPANYWFHRTPARAWTEGEPRTSWIRLLAFLTVTEFRSRYRAQALGVMWSLLSPIAMMGALTVVFGPTFDRGGHYPVFLLVGLVLWNFVSLATNASINSLVAKRELVTRSLLARELIPLSVMLSYLINLGLEVLTLVVVSLFLSRGILVSASLLVVPVFVLALVVLLAGVGLAGAALNALYRDVAYLVTTGLMFLFWLTPIVYPLDAVGQPYRTIISYNPIAAILEAIRGATLDGIWPTTQAWLLVGGSAVGLFALGLYAFRRLEPAMLDRV